MATALKNRTAPRVASKTKPVCPAEACLREWATEQRRWRPINRAYQPTILPSGAFAPWPEADRHIEILNEITDRATRSVALSQVGAAFQALLLYGASPIHKDDEPAGLTEAQKEPFSAHEELCTRIGLSLYRVLSADLNDRDLAMFLGGITAGDTLA